MHRGIMLPEHGLPHAEYGPLYSLWYYLLSLFEKDNIRLYYLNYRILISSTILAIYIYLRRLNVAPAVSFISSFLYLSSGVWLISDKLITHFALLVLLIFLIALKFLRPKSSYRCITALGLLTVSFIRPEYFVSFIIFSCASSFLIWHRLKSGIVRPGTVLPKLLLFLLAAFSLIYIFGSPLSGGRAWVAFSQQFSQNYVRWHNIRVDPWSNSEKIINSVFGDADTMIECARVNTRAFLKHILYNAAGYIRNSIDILYLRFRQPATLFLDKLIRQIETLFFIVLIIYIIIKGHRVSRASGDGDLNHLGLLFWALILPVLFSAIFIYPKKYYLIIQSAMFTILASYIVSTTAGPGVRQMKLSPYLLIGALILILTPRLAAGWAILPNEAGLRQARLPKLKTIEFIRSLNITEGVNILVVGGGYFVYLPENYREIKVREKKEPFDDYIEDHRINMILFNKRFGRDTRVADDSEFKSFLHEHRSYGFTKLEIPGAKNILFVKGELLDKDE